MLLQLLSLACAGLQMPSVTRRHAIAASVTLLPIVTHAAVPTGDREGVSNVALPMGNEVVNVKRQKFTGAGDPVWTYPESELTSRLYGEWPASWPYTENDFRRMDEAPDTTFYRVPKLVYHIDEGAVSSLMRYYDRSIRDGSDVLDICSSWVSHYPPDFPQRMKSIVGTGISAKELACNDQLGRSVQQDLNVNPKLPFPDKSFDTVTCVVSFDYLTQPLKLMQEIGRVLRPGGSVILSQSNRCFFTKAVGVWTSDMSDAAHLRVLGTYIHFAGGLFADPQAFDISPRGPGTNDPMYIVTAKRV